MIPNGARNSIAGYGASDGQRNRFTSKERDDESGMDYFIARYYSGAQGRFTSPDEFAGGPQEFWVLGSGDSQGQALPYADIFEPQSLNKYQYCFNNPLNSVDPNGHQSLRKFAEEIGLLTPTPNPASNSTKQVIINQTVPGSGGLTVGQIRAAQDESYREAASAIETYNSLFVAGSIANGFIKTSQGDYKGASVDFIMGALSGPGKGATKIGGKALEEIGASQLAKRFIVSRGGDITKGDMADLVAISKNGVRGVVQEVTTATSTSGKGLTKLKEQLKAGYDHLIKLGVSGDNIKLQVRVSNAKFGSEVMKNLGEVAGKTVQVIVGK